MLKNNTSESSSARTKVFWSSEHTTASYKPYVSVTYTFNASFSNAEIITSNVYKSVNISSPNQKRYYSFTPTSTGFYAIESSSAIGDPYGWLYNSNQVQLALNDDGAGSLNFRMVYHLELERTYYIGVGCYSTGTGSYQLRITPTVNLNGGISSISTDNYLNAPTELSTITDDSLNISTALQRRYYSFTAPTAGDYIFQSFGNTSSGPIGWVYDNNRTQLNYSDDINLVGGNYNFRTTEINLQANEKVYLVAGCYGTLVGNFFLTLMIH